MLEEVKRFGNLKSADIQREVPPVTPYRRIDPKQERQEGYPQQEAEKRPDGGNLSRRRFTAIRELIEILKDQTQITRVNFNTANQELTDLGLAVVEEELLPQLLQLKIPLASIEDLIRQIRQQGPAPKLVSGRSIPPDTDLLPVVVKDLAEYVMRFDNLQVGTGTQHSDIFDEINRDGRFSVEYEQIRLNFSRVATLPVGPGDTLNLTISIQVGAVEVDENGRRAIFYQRPDKSYALYSDKLLNLTV